MAERSPLHKLTRTRGGWVKRIRGTLRWICSDKVAPTADAADEFFTGHIREFVPAAGTESPIPADAAGVPVSDLSDVFLARLRARRDLGKMEPGTYAEYAKALQAFGKAVGHDTPAGKLGPAHFGKFLTSLTRLGSHRRKKFIVRVRSLFRWAAKKPISLPLPEYGEDFKIPSRREFRIEKKRRRERDGLLLFTPEEIRLQLAGTTVMRKRQDGTDYRPAPCRPTPAMRAMILLGINAGFGNTDLAELPLSVINLNAGWIDYARGKTGGERRAWLWPETVHALRDYLPRRPKPARAAYAALAFLTSEGNPLIRDFYGPDGEWKRQEDKIAENYGRLLLRLGQKRTGRNFYSLRRSFRTFGAEVGSELVLDFCMGHVGDAEDMSRVYTQTILDKMIYAVCSHVRNRVLGLSPAE